MKGPCAANGESHEENPTLPKFSSPLSQLNSSTFPTVFFKMSSLTISGRAQDDNDAQAEMLSPAAEESRANGEHSSHPYFILEHLMKNVLPEKCRNEKVAAFYKDQLDNPIAAIEECQSKLADWVLTMWDRGTLWDYHR